MASVNIKPLEDKLVVQASEAETTTASGIVIPDTAKEKPQEGKVLAVGPGRIDDKGNRTGCARLLTNKSFQPFAPGAIRLSRWPSVPIARGDYSNRLFLITRCSRLRPTVRGVSARNCAPRRPISWAFLRAAGSVRVR